MSSAIAYISAFVVAYLSAHIIKYLLTPSGKRGLSVWLSSGGMPSSHTAIMVALASTIYFNEGVSDLFAVVAVLSTIIIYDALNSRRSVGEQGLVLLKLIEKSPFAKDPLPRVAIGHKPAEALAGGVLGVVVGYFVSLLIV